MNGEDEKSIKKMKAQQAGRDIADTAGRAIATYAGGAAGAEAYDAFAKTKLGEKLIDKAGEKVANKPFMEDKLAKKQPLISKAKPAVDAALGGDPKSSSKKSIENSKESKVSADSLAEENGGTGLFETVKTGIYIKIAAIAAALLFLLILIVIVFEIFSTMISPFVYIADKAS